MREWISKTTIYYEKEKINNEFLICVHDLTKTKKQINEMRETASKFVGIN